MRRSATSAVFAGVMLAVVNVAAAQPTVPPPALTVCITMSHSVAAAARREGAVIEEVEAIWRPMGVAIRLRHRSDKPCDRLIAVRSDLEAAPEDASAETALGWVPFVEGRPRQLVYLRVSRAHTMIAAVAPGKRPGGMTDLLVAKLLGRTLAHELAHVLLNSKAHDTTGLMRSLYRAEDVLRDPPEAYTLDAQQRARLFANYDIDTRLARRSATLQCGHRPCMVTYRFGPYLLTPDQRRVERDGAAVPLTPKAFDLLVTLVRHRSRALSKDEIMTLVWPETQVEEGNLAQQVLLLRRALSDAGDCVATLPRHGYRFVAPIVEEHEGTAAAQTSPHVLIWDGREFPLREGVTAIGRAEDADLRIPLPSVSRQHARIVVSALGATLEDLGSLHGSWRGMMPVRGAVLLSSGDEIRLGTATLVYVLAMPDESTRK